MKIYDFAPATSGLRLKKPQRPLRAWSACVQALSKSMIAKLLKACFWCHPQYDYSSHPEIWNNMRDLGPGQFTMLLNTFQLCSFQANSELHVDIYMVPRVVGHPLKNFEGCALNVGNKYKPGWISLCLECWMPQLNKCLERTRPVNIISLQPGWGLRGQMHQHASETHQQANKREPHLQACITAHASTLATVFRNSKEDIRNSVDPHEHAQFFEQKADAKNIQACALPFRCNQNMNQLFWRTAGRKQDREIQEGNADKFLMQTARQPHCIGHRLYEIAV